MTYSIEPCGCHHTDRPGDPDRLCSRHLAELTAARVIDEIARALDAELAERAAR